LILEETESIANTDKDRDRKIPSKGYQHITDSRSGDGRSSRRVVVIGGGPAGYFAAIECAHTLNTLSMDTSVHTEKLQHDNQQQLYSQETTVQKKAKKKGTTEVIVLEAGPKTLAKVWISGGGRCNLMHDADWLGTREDTDMETEIETQTGMRSKPHLSMREFLQLAYPRGDRELNALYTSLFGPKETEQWFERQGLSLMKERDGRVFPSSGESKSVVKVLEDAMKREQIITVHCHRKVEKVRWNEEKTCFEVVYQVTDRDRDDRELDGDVGMGGESDDNHNDPTEEMIECDRVILATGSSR
jgi:predicted flavoprotein YhiN